MPCAPRAGGGGSKSAAAHSRHRARTVAVEVDKSIPCGLLCTQILYFNRNGQKPFNNPFNILPKPFSIPKSLRMGCGASQNWRLSKCALNGVRAFFYDSWADCRSPSGAFLSSNIQEREREREGEDRNSSW